MPLQGNNRQKLERHKAKVERKLAGAPEIQIFEDKLREWQAVQDSDLYVTSFGPFNKFAVRWARLIQVNLAVGMPFNRAARLAFREANYDNISWGALQFAVTTLSMGWVHGDQLEKWHSEEYGSLHGLASELFDTVKRKTRSAFDTLLSRVPTHATS